MADVKFIYTTSDELENLPVVNGQLIVLTDTSGFYYDMDDTRHAGSSSGSGGHIIKDADGVALPQRSALQIAGYLTASDDSTNNATLISAAPTTVTWSDYSAKTDAQKEGTEWLIVDYPDTIDSIGISTMKNQTLTFNNLVAEIIVPGMTAATHLLVFYHDKDTAQNAGIVADTAAGKVVFTAESEPSETVICDIVYWDDTAGGSASGGSRIHYMLTLPTTGYDQETVVIWGSERTCQVITLTQDKDGNPLSDFTDGMLGDYPINAGGTLTDFIKLYAYEISTGAVTFYLTEVPSTAFDVLIREAT